MEKLIPLFIIMVMASDQKCQENHSGRGSGGDDTCGNAECGGSEVSNSARAICIPPAAAGLA